MRIIAGAFKGRRLAAPSWEGLRPTSDKLRETLFNVIAARVAGARVLDGYAGTGAVGLEALSRGAAHVTFVERDPRACKLIAENVERCGVVDSYTIVRGRLVDAARRLPPEPFDLAFLDPPYADPDVEASVSAALAWLSPSGLLVLEHAARAPSGEVPGARLTRTLRSGDSALSFFERAFFERVEGTVMERIAIYPGSFDPLTNGHVDIILRGARLFDRIVVAILVNPDKTPLFTPEERVELVRAAFADEPKVVVDTFHGLLVDYARQQRASVIVRGLRAVSDFEYEMQMALMNRHLSPDLETVFMMPGEAYTYLSSRLVKEVFALGGSIAGLVPPVVEQRLLGRKRAI